MLSPEVRGGRRGASAPWIHLAEHVGRVVGSHKSFSTPSTSPPCTAAAACAASQTCSTSWTRSEQDLLVKLEERNPQLDADPRKMFSSRTSSSWPRAICSADPRARDERPRRRHEERQHRPPGGPAQQRVQARGRSPSARKCRCSARSTQEVEAAQDPSSRSAAVSKRRRDHLDIGADRLGSLKAKH
jgi:hypothetical protein